MRRPLLIAAVTALAAPALAVPARAATPGQFFPGDPIDSGVTRVGDLDLGRDGAGGVVYVKPNQGADHIFVSRFADGAFQPPERLDPGTGAAGSQPVVAAGEGGRLVVAFVSGGTVVAAVKPAADQPWTAPQPLATGASDPAVDASVNGPAYVTFTAPGGGGHDVRAARLERGSGTFTVLGDVLDVASGNDAGTGTGRSRVSISADGSAIATWGEAGNVNARRLFGLRVSQAPQLVAAGADAPDIGLEDDSGFGWALARQGAAIVVRHLLGATFDPPVPVGVVAAPGLPRLAVGPRGEGFAGFSGGGTAFGAVLKDDIFSGAVGLGAPADGPVAPAVAYNGLGAIAYAQSGAVLARRYDTDIATRVVTAPGPPVTISRAELGPVDPVDGGVVASSDRAGNVAVAFAQGAPGARTLAGAVFDRAPGAFRGLTTTQFRRPSQRLLDWSGASDIWGPITYTVVIDGQPALQVSGASRGTLPAPLADGVHTWSVTATDRRGQVAQTAPRQLRYDGRAPGLRITVKRSAGAVSVTTRTSDPPAPGAGAASGVKSVTIDWGDGTRVTARRASHRYTGRGAVTLKVSARDAAGNVTQVTRRVSRG